MTKPNYSLAGKVAIVTGAKQGTGKEIALTFAEAGADVAICSRSVEDGKLEAVAKQIQELGRRSMAVQADVSEPDDVDRMVDSVISNLGGVHILVNNAGITGEYVPTIESSIEFWDKVVKIHLRGTYLFCRRVGQWMVPHKTGKVINIGSIAAGFPMRTSYGSAKGGIVYMTRSLALEWAQYNINVNCIVPGYIMTPLFKELVDTGKLDGEALRKRTPLGRFAEVDDIAKAALFLVSEDAKHITGVDLPVDGGWLANTYI